MASIEIDGVRFETESPFVFSTGTFLDTDGITPGFGRGETLHTNGFLQFTDPLADSLGPDQIVAVDADGFQAVNSETISDADGEGAGAAFVFDGASGDFVGDQVAGSVFNSGTVQGRGTGAGNQTGHGL